MKEIKQNNLEFDKDNHIYRLNGKIIPSVSKILADGGLSNLSSINPKILEHSRKWGEAVHKLTELNDKQILNTQFDANLVDDYNNWNKFIAELKIKIIEIEKQVYSVKWKFAGTLDRIITCNKKNNLILLDIKTSIIIPPATRLQTALYKIAYEEMTELKIKERWCVQLLAKDGYKISQFKDRMDEYTALNFVNCYHWRQENGYGNQN